MTYKARTTTESQPIGWFAGAVIVLLLMSLGLELLAHQVFGPTSMAIMLLSLYLGVWFAALGIAGFLVLSVRWIADALQLKRAQRAFDQHLVDDPEREDPTGRAPGVHVIELEREDQATTRSRVA